jgi:toxin ParE1/3/4
MSRARFSADAEADLLAIVEFIAQDNPNAAREWLQSIRERCELLAQHPLTGESRPGFGIAGCRSVSVGVYVIFFRPMPNGPEIARILHGSRDLGNL